jgi:polyisoprenoid-binding protein YceI
MAIYKIDPAHSEISFKIKHLMITNVTGSFTKFEGTMESSKDDFTDAQIHFEADTESITTHNEQRDAHLRSAEFFDAEKNPKLTFDSTSVKKDDEDNYKLLGNLTMHGITKPVTLNVELMGVNKDPWGQTKVGFEVTGKLSRKEFDLTWNAALEGGGVLVGDEVKLHMSVQLIKQA